MSDYIILDDNGHQHVIVDRVYAVLDKQHYIRFKEETYTMDDYTDLEYNTINKILISEVAVRQLMAWLMEKYGAKP